MICRKYLVCYDKRKRGLYMKQEKRDIEFELQLEKTNMYDEITKFIKQNKLNKEQAEELLFLVEDRINTVIWRFDKTIPFASIKRLEK